MTETSPARKSRARHHQREAEHFASPRIDWRALLADLNANGCSLYRVAQHLRVSESTARMWLRLKYDMSYGHGRALIRLHARYCGASTTLKRLTSADDCAYTSHA